MWVACRSTGNLANKTGGRRCSTAGALRGCCQGSRSAGVNVAHSGGAKNVTMTLRRSLSAGLPSDTWPAAGRKRPRQSRLSARDAPTEQSAPARQGWPTSASPDRPSGIGFSLSELIATDGRNCAQRGRSATTNLRGGAYVRVAPAKRDVFTLRHNMTKTGLSQVDAGPRVFAPGAMRQARRCCASPRCGPELRKNQSHGSRRGENQKRQRTGVVTLHRSLEGTSRRKSVAMRRLGGPADRDP